MMNSYMSKSLVIGARRATLMPKTTFVSSLQYSTKNEEKAAPKKETDGQIFDPRFIGLTKDQYIPVSWKNCPNPLTSPRAAWNVLLRRIYTFGINTIQVGLLRYQTGLKPKFLLWKNNAIENYVVVNKAFAEKNVPSVSKDVSVWVDKALTARSSSIPNNISLKWKLAKFNEKPKLITFRPIMLPNQPVEYVQIVYKFNTKQQLVKVNLDTEEVSKVTRDVIDYAGFLVDLHSNKTFLSGTLFENNPEDKIPKPEEADQQSVMNDMRIHGDIFRLPPANVKDNAKITKEQ